MECDFPRVSFDIGGPDSRAFPGEINPLEKITPEVTSSPPEYSNILNPLESRGSCSATSTNMKLVQWPLMGGLLVTFGTASSSLYQM